MLDNQLSEVIEKLDNETRLALEDAVSLAFNQNHAITTLEHWLLQLITQPMGTVIKQNIPVQSLQKKLQSLLKQHNTEHSGAPALAVELIQILRHAWLTISLKQGTEKISLINILETLLSEVGIDCLQEDIRSELIGVHNALQNVSNSIESRAVSETSLVLQRYTQDLTDAAQSGKIDPVIGREQEIHNLITILLRRRQNNPLLIGDAGVGKTAVAEGFAMAIIEHKVPKVLQNTKVLSLDLAALQAGAGTKGEFERRLQDFVKAVHSSSTPIIIFIDEVHNLMGAGNQQGKGDAANLLKPLLARGELRTIAATTWSEYKKHIEPDPALTRRFQLIPINEPSTDETAIILRGLQNKLAKHHKVTILNEAIIAAVEFSERYINDKQLPDKALSLLDSACAQVKLSHVSVPMQLQRLRSQLQSEQQTLLQLKNELNFGFVHSMAIEKIIVNIKQLNKEKKKLEKKWQLAKDQQKQLSSLQKKLDGSDIIDERTKIIKNIKSIKKKLDKINQPNVNRLLCVDKITIANTIAAWTGIPVNRMLADTQERMRYVRAELFKRVLGQEMALTQLANRVDISLAQLHDPNKPLGVFMLCGSSGIGKTETALALAEALHGSERQLITLNMSEFKEAHKVSQLLGSPAGYIGYGEGGLLTEAVRKKPYSVLLLDELEKAHPSVQEIFYQVFDKGTLTDATGREVNFKNTFILMTTNVGTTLLTKYHNQQDSSRSYTDLVDLVHDELHQAFKPAFLGRITLLPYLPLDNNSLIQITELKLRKLQKRYKNQYGKNLKVNNSTVNNIVRQCHHVEHGARMIDKIIEQELLNWMNI